MQSDKFDSNKEQKSLRRIDGAYVLSEIVSVLYFDKGILYTIKELLFRPGKNVHTFIHTDRNRLVKPLIFLMICSLIYALAEQFLKFEEGYVQAGGFGDSTVNHIFSWIQGNYGYSNIMMSLFIALWVKLFFKKYDYNIFEIIILLCFVMGIGMLIYTIVGVLESLTDWNVLAIGGIIGFIYTSWAIGQFFDGKKKINYLMSFIAYIMGMVTFYTAAILLGTLIDSYANNF